MLAAWLAIAGIFPSPALCPKTRFSGSFFQFGPRRDLQYGRVRGRVGAAGLTAIYMTRLMMMTFMTKSRMEHDVEHHVHESHGPWPFR